MAISPNIRHPTTTCTTVTFMTFKLDQWLLEKCPELSSYLDQTPPESLSDNPIKAADSREWLLTNGLGSYAAGSISGANTRRYHGLFVASLNYPVQRVVLLSRMDEKITVNGQAFELGANVWKSGAVAPEGHKLIGALAHHPGPTWCYILPGHGRLIKQLLMRQADQHIYIVYSWLADQDATAQFDISVLLNYRDFHGQTVGADNWHFQQEQHADHVKITAYPGAEPLFLQSDQGRWQADSVWYRGYFWPREYERGLADNEDCLRAGRFKLTLTSGQSAMISAGLSPLAKLPSPSNLMQEIVARQNGLLIRAESATPAVVKYLVLAADQFLVQRKSTAGSTVIAGYPWFSDWGRDSMISLTGLCLVTGRLDEAKSILATFARYCSEGMLPNYFPDGGQAPSYNTIDATLWCAYALYRYYQASGDKEFVKNEQLPLLREVYNWHNRGTRHGIKVETDSLISGGDSHIQLTWMDAKCGDYVVTPRHGKAVEINALWHNFVATLTYLHREVYPNMTIYGGIDKAIANGFEKFWDEERGYLADLIRPDGSCDWAIRPNQIFAAGLPFPVISRERAKRMLGVVEEHLLTPMGLRTLSPSHPDYKGQYGLGKDWANQFDRDVTYHQGTVWPWLLGHWVDARIYAFGETDENLTFIATHLKPLIDHLDKSGCLGSINEIFDGDAPHKPQGCTAQAWSVAELLRVLRDYPQLLA